MTVKTRNHDKRHLTRAKTRSSDRDALGELKRRRGYAINPDGTISFGEEAMPETTKEK